MGGIMAWSTIENNTDRFAGVIPIVSRYGWESIPNYGELLEPVNPYSTAPIASVKDNPVLVISRRIDRTFIYEDISWQMEQLENLGVNITQHVVDDVEHRDAPGFIPHLKKSIPWLVDNFDI